MAICVATFFRSEAQGVYVREISVHSDNDAYLFLNQDQYYTNGVAFNYRRLKEDISLPSRQKKQIWEVSLGHKLFNAYNGFSELEYMDRPFTAFLYLRGQHTWFYSTESIFSVSSEMGFFGKAAKGEEIQKAFHNLFGFYDINGWDYQLRSNFTVDIRASYSAKLWRNTAKTVDVQAGSKISIGLNQSHIGVGPTLRIGNMNALYESALTGSRLGLSNRRVNKERYFYYRPILYYRFYDASIQGGMFLQDKGPVTFGIQSWVLSQQIGFIYAKNHLSLDARFQFNTKEVKSRASPHQYGSITLGYAF
ncbi:lipid A deacylase LpxR family protein [Olivibacter sp. SDN3]|uniref:lipid A deacylase LpxR family protein n=1 Tax=Olivibacter sp. SDN3 TaxID=2764720 RepID=UPI0016515A63|nr:lipid A deacylase LpxR family protein [Olivibacter sp. SDN3]QNL49675.1 lipid A deacylase LpxR family protein [Olivibacter sp. SDN3]